MATTQISVPYQGNAALKKSRKVFGENRKVAVVKPFKGGDVHVGSKRFEKENAFRHPLGEANRMKAGGVTKLPGKKQQLKHLTVTEAIVNIKTVAVTRQDEFPVPVKPTETTDLVLFKPAAAQPDETDTIQDCDIDDIEDPFYCTDYVEDIFRYLMDTEQRPDFSIPRDYLHIQTKVTPYHRAVLVDWLVQVHRKFKLLQETLYITIDTIDRYLKVQEVSKQELQLLGITSMFLASKYEEIYPPYIGDFSYISADTYTTKQISHMERTILRSLEYKLNKPYCLQFLRRYSKVSESTLVEHNMAKYILEQALLDAELVTVRPSLRAAAALLLSHQFLKRPKTPSTLEDYTRYTAAQLMETRHRLKANLVPSSYPKKLESVQKKYESKDFMEVAKHTSLLPLWK